MRILSLIIALLLANPVAAKTPAFEKIKVDPDIELIRINENYYVHTSWFDFPGFGRFPSNGLLFVKNGQALLIDTPNTNEQTLSLYRFVHDTLKADITKVIVGHHHSDCMGGLSALHEKGVESFACAETLQICKTKNSPIPQHSFTDAMAIHVHGETVICRYFGAGHTVDNSLVYFPASQILFGGCLIKSLDAKGLGNIREADIEMWDQTVLRLKRAYPSIKLVVPGHGAIGDSRLLDHTIALVKDHKRKTK